MSSIFSLRFTAVACVVILASACADQSVLSVPSKPTSPGGYTISGLVTESEGNPVSGARVYSFVTTANGGYAGPNTVTDASGRYVMRPISVGTHVWLETGKDGYVQQCAAPELALQSDMTVNLMLVSRTHLTGSGVPSQPGLRSVSGVVVDGKTGAPAAGAYVDFEPIVEVVEAVTYSDAVGQFTLCGLPQDQSVWLSATAGDKSAFVNVPPGQTTVTIAVQ